MRTDNDRVRDGETLDASEGELVTVPRNRAAEAQRHDQAAWVAMFDVLQREGIITEHDRHALQSARDTPGTRAIAAIREWGEATRVNTRAREAARRRDGGAL